ncbi:MFS transporter [Actinokineospora sp.]|uniref:MFS transporter n=1 Tax=Actinokineospora sp. TaxID=1872133 RepID=UPI004037FB69
MGETGLERTQRRTIAVLFLSQLVGGLGVGIGIAVGVLFAARLTGQVASGLAGSTMVLGTALTAVPVSRLMQRHGRRAGLVAAYLTGAAGAALLAAAAVTSWVGWLFPGMFLFGGGTTANLQARFAAVDLATAERRGRSLSTVVWATTVGAVAGPVIAAAADGGFRGMGLPTMTGAFAVSGGAFALAALVVFVLLRPDPLTLARSQGAAQVRRGGTLAALRHIASVPAARFGLAGVAIGHFGMIALMSMTPVHLDHGAHGGTDLGVIGVVVSVHLAGMYALSPLAGWATDRLGRKPVIGCGMAMLVAACLVAAAFPHDVAAVTLSLGLLGLGWSASLIAGSTLVTDSVEPERRPASQGACDLTMGLAGALASGAAGLVLAALGFSVFALLCGLAIVVLLGLVLAVGTRDHHSQLVPSLDRVDR